MPSAARSSEAVAALLQAEAITPEQVRGHALVRQLVSDLLTMQDPPAAELRDLAKRLTAKHRTDTLCISHVSWVL